MRVAVSALLTIALFAGYCAADIADIAPGLLTLKPVAEPTFADPAVAKTADTLVADLDDDVPIDATKAQSLIDTLLAADGVGDDVSVIIEDAQGNVAAEHNAATPREPASTMKTLTALAASSTLDMAATLDTEVFLIQADDGATLVLKGNGDMLLGDGESDANHINGRAGLTTLAKAAAYALEQRGISTVTLVYDDSLFGEQRSPANISANNGDYLYYTPISSMAIDGGRQWSASLPAPANPDESGGYPPLSQTTAKDTADRFADLLAEQGIGVKGEVSQGSVPSGLSPIASVSSATLREILAFTLRTSDNTLAEEFGRLTALERGDDNSPEGATNAVRSTLDELGIDTDGLTMADCSGLSPGSSLSVRTLVAVQQRNLTLGSGAAAAEGLSVAGLVGTAKNRYTDESAAGLLRVKTGSLGTVTSMSGNVSRDDGGALAFAVIVNDPEDYEGARAAINAFVTSLASL